MQKKEPVQIPFRRTAQYPCKKTVSLTPEIDQMWLELSKIYKVEVVEAVRPLIEDQIRKMYGQVTSQSA